MVSNGAAGQLPRQFSASRRRELLSHVVGKHTGVIVHIFGVDFDLIALSTAEVMSVLGILENVADMLQGQELSDIAILRVITKDGKRVEVFVHDYLKRCADINDEEEAQVFEEWWDLVPNIEAIKLLAVPLLEVNGISIKGPFGKTGASATSAQSMPADSSSPTPAGTPTVSSTG